MPSPCFGSENSERLRKLHVRNFWGECDDDCVKSSRIRRRKPRFQAAHRCRHPCNRYESKLKEAMTSLLRSQVKTLEVKLSIELTQLDWSPRRIPHESASNEVETID